MREERTPKRSLSPLRPPKTIGQARRDELASLIRMKAYGESISKMASELIDERFPDWGPKLRLAQFERSGGDTHEI